MSSRKNIGIELIISAVVVIVFAAAAFVVYPMIFQPNTEINLGTATFHARLAMNDADRANGLSGVTSLNYDEALLEVYSTDDKWPVSMKDMKMPIDIVWLNKDKRVVYLIRNAQPQSSLSYKIFKPTVKARYVLELPTGSVNARTIKLNSTAVFDIEKAKVE